MVALFEKHDGVVCRACGATHATPSDTKETFGACHYCWEKFTRDNKDYSEHSFNRWLARFLYLDLKRLLHFGVCGRCEAISGWLYGNGHQCANYAMAMREGRKVCASHLRATEVNWTGTVHGTPYDEYEELLADLGVIDERFALCLRRAVEHLDLIQS